MSDETEEIKQAFRNADTNGDGFITKEELGPLLENICGFGSEEIEEMFAAIDSDENGRVSYEEFVDWIVNVPEEEEAVADDLMDALVEGDEGEKDEEGSACCDDEDGSACCEDECNSEDWGSCEEFHEYDDWEDMDDCEMDTSQTVTRDEFLMMAKDFDIDVGEAGGIYDWVCEAGECEEANLLDLLYEMDVEVSDAETMYFIESCLGGVRQRIEAGEAPEEGQGGEDSLAWNSAMGKISDNVLEDGTMPDVQGLIDNGDLHLSAAEASAIAQVDPGDLSEKIQHAHDNPPMISATAGQHACVERCSQEVANIIAKCTAEGTKYTDSSFDVTASDAAVLYVDKEHPGYDCTVGKPHAWKRLSEIVSEPVLIKDENKPSGIKQGDFGDCWLLGAIDAVLARDPRSCKKLFVKYDFEVGVFGVRFCRDGEWVYVIIDDYLPVTDEGSLLYASARDEQEVWLPLLEKAFCKLYTCFEMCDGGQPHEAIFCFFGGVSGFFAISDKHKEDPSSYFKMVQAAKKRGFLLNTGFDPPEKSSVGNGKCGEDILDCGLVKGHAYSVLRLVEAGGNQLLCLRNPWGTGEWTGKWSDKNADGEWTTEMQEACQWTDADDGKFWMSVEDFVKFASEINYARTFGLNWKKLTKRSSFQKGTLQATVIEDYKADADDELSLEKGKKVQITDATDTWYTGKFGDEEGYFPANCVAFKDRLVARFDLKASSLKEGTKEKLIVMLMQPTSTFARKFYKRKEDGLNYKDLSYVDITLTVVGADGKVKFHETQPDRMVWGEIAPSGGGDIKIYASSAKGNGQKFSVRVYAQGGDYTLTEVKGTKFSELHNILKRDAE
eukprot:TRINITY_DN720_c0_g2_i1.p1 TRINITY_DN720_c0_g2~~TRINITY_DN720_c0_g2_i1.p1  ORF type:complete len:838 (-),score=214.84 TRINITY_DN720_c0_g2_i1:45-2558(-)